MLNALGQHDAVLGELGPDHVDQLGALADQQVPCSVERHDRLLLGRFDRDEAHRRSRHRFADGLRIGGVGLAPLDVGFDVSQRHQFHLMTQPS